MALTAYCKKCNREVPPGDICPYCGTKLAKSATHAAWVLERRPAADWMCWNAVMRWLVPAGFAVLVLALVLEGLSGGAAAVERLFRGSFPLTLGILLLGILLVVLAALLLQGRELMDYVIDSRGIHVTRYLPEPTAVKLIARLKSPGLLAQADPENPVLALETRDLAWKDVARVQLWPEKCYILFYAPAWWLRIPTICTPFSWDDTIGFAREKLSLSALVSIFSILTILFSVGPIVRSRPASPADRVVIYLNEQEQLQGYCGQSDLALLSVAAKGQIRFSTDQEAPGNTFTVLREFSETDKALNFEEIPPYLILIHQ